MGKRRFRVGDKVIYLKEKHSTSPGPRAQDVSPAPKGETYSYLVEKYWIVQEVQDDGTIILLTRTGKQHAVQPDDLHLRHAKWWERWWHRRRFPELPQEDK